MFVAGRDVEAAAAAAIASCGVDVAARIAWSARCRCISHRIPILLDAEVNALGAAETTLASLRRDLCGGESSSPSWWVSKRQVRRRNVDVGAAGDTVTEPSRTITVGGKAVPEGLSSGPMREIIVDVEWPGLEDWRARHGLPRRSPWLGIVVGLARQGEHEN